MKKITLKKSYASFEEFVKEHKISKDTVNKCFGDNYFTKNPMYYNDKCINKLLKFLGIDAKVKTVYYSTNINEPVTFKVIEKKKESVKTKDTFFCQVPVKVKAIVDNIFNVLELDINRTITKKQILNALTPELCQEYANRNVRNLIEHMHDEDALIRADNMLDIEFALMLDLITTAERNHLVETY